MLFAVARDNEIQYLSRAIHESSGDLLMELAEASIRCGEPDAKWQFAEELGQVRGTSQRGEELLLALARDPNEYVRRRALQSLARIRSAATERVALEAWSRPNEQQQWSRMMALWALRHVGSDQLQRLLIEAMEGEGTLLSQYAAKIGRGEIEP